MENQPYIDPETGDLICDDQGDAKLFVPWSSVRLAFPRLLQGIPLSTLCPRYPYQRAMAAALLRDRAIIEGMLNEGK